MQIIIKRYRNRKLYNTQTKRYITLEEIADLFNSENEIKVIDNPSGADITSVALSQIIFEKEKNQNGFLPIKLLVWLVQHGGKRIDHFYKGIFEAIAQSLGYDEEIDRRINTLIGMGELSPETGKQLLQKLLSINKLNNYRISDIDGVMQDYMNSQELTTKNNIRPLIIRVDELSRKLDEFSIQKAG